MSYIIYSLYTSHDQNEVPGSVKRAQKEIAITPIYNTIIKSISSGNRGKSCYFLPEEFYIGLDRSPCKSLTDEDIVELLKEKFPDCRVSLQEVLFDSRQVKKGILIDWS